MTEDGYKRSQKLDQSPSKIMRFSAFFVGALGDIQKGNKRFSPFGLLFTTEGAKHHDLDLISKTNKKFNLNMNPQKSPELNHKFRAFKKSFIYLLVSIGANDLTKSSTAFIWVK
ncbi:hypothetical protein [Shewanella sp. UCD-KL21]|uniref:hypothetical protein n=1 Tax=Shewanella sp. UCD-KL21 TaxID=1917164 RepID=UPI0011154F94|nr:hypothetical protein [Shewanella sp. UCD-KL21]